MDGKMSFRRLHFKNCLHSFNLSQRFDPWAFRYKVHKSNVKTTFHYRQLPTYTFFKYETYLRYFFTFQIMKPLLERKRRARINKCLDELKDIMTAALQAQGENVSKLEKADILELTVRHLHKMQQAKCLNTRNPIEELRRFQTGYSSCAQEATSFLMNTPGVDASVSHRLLSYLSSQMSNPMTTAAAVRIPAELFHPPAMSPFNPRLVCQPPTSPGSLPTPSSLHPKLGRFSPSSTADANSNKISIKASPSPPLMQGLSPPPPKSDGASSPPLASSTPQTRGRLTVSITATGAPGVGVRMIDPNSVCGLNPSSDMIVPSTSSSSSSSSLAALPTNPSVIKPAPIRLSPSDPVWRPF